MNLQMQNETMGNAHEQAVDYKYNNILTYFPRKIH